MTVLRTVILATTSIAITGCVPIPQVRITKPELDGTLHIKGVATKGVVITSCVDGLSFEHCERITQTMTNEQGQFYIPKETQFYLVRALIGDPFYFFGIKFTHAEQNYEWASAGIGFSPARIKIDCDLEADLKCKILDNQR